MEGNTCMNALNQQLDPEAIRLAALTKRQCAETGCERLCSDAYAVTILAHAPNSATRLVESLGGKVSELLERSREMTQTRKHDRSTPKRAYFSIGVDESCKKMAQAAEQFRTAIGAPRITATHILLGSLKANPALAAVFDGTGIGLRVLETAALRNKEQQRPTPQQQTTHKAQPIVQPDSPKTPTTNPLTEFCTDLTAMAAAEKIDPVIGREREIDR